MNGGVYTVRLKLDRARLAVLSDSHGLEFKVMRALELAGEADAVIFLGDGVSEMQRVSRRLPDINLLMVRGNNDWGSDAPEELCVEVAGARLYCTHGHRSNVYFDRTRLYMRTLELNADAALYGHTHIALNELKNGVLLLNPGSVSLPRAGCPSCAVLEVEKGEVNAYNIEL